MSLVSWQKYSVCWVQLNSHSLTENLVLVFRCIFCFLTACASGLIWGAQYNECLWWNRVLSNNPIDVWKRVYVWSYCQIKFLQDQILCRWNTFRFYNNINENKSFCSVWRYSSWTLKDAVIQKRVTHMTLWLFLYW